MRYALIVLLLIIAGCGSKKRITHIKRGAEVSVEERNITQETTSETEWTDTTKTKTKSNEKESASTVETWVWRKDGTPVSYTKEVKGIKVVEKQIEELKGLSGSNTTTAKLTDLSVLSDVKTTENIDDNIEKTNPQPAFFKGWWWVMVVIAALILGAMWFVIKRKL